MYDMNRAVKAINVAFGNPEGDPKNVDLEELRRQAAGVKEEYEEFIEALDNNDPKGMRDAACDIMVFALGIFHKAGWDADEDMRAVITALSSRLCRDQSELQETMRHYHMVVGISVYAEGFFPMMAVKSATDQKGHDGKYYPKNKFLKNIYFKEPEFS